MATSFTIPTLAVSGNSTFTGTITNNQDCTIAGTGKTLTCGNIQTAVVKNGGSGITFNNENLSSIGNITNTGNITSSGVVQGSALTAGAAGGHTYLTIPSTSVASNTASLNGKIGVVSFTGQTITNGATTTFTITNVGAGSDGLVHFIFSGSAATATSLYVQSVTWSQGVNIVVVLANAGASTTPAGTFTIKFMSFN